ncbi:MAG: phage holin family protein [Ilumatobacteraceae bacterium]
MLRFIARTVILLIANAIGLIVAAWALPDMSLSFTGLILDTVVFTVIVMLAQPFIAKTAMKNGGSLTGASALLAAFVALVLTNWWSDDMQIRGATTWLLATVIVWAAALIAALLLPTVMFKKWLAQQNG